jgi:hypothetical protein
VNTANVHLCFEWDDQVIVDDHEQAGGIAQNTMSRPTSQSSGMNADEFDFRRSSPGAHPTNSFWHRTVGMVMTGRSGSVFRSELDKSYEDLDGPDSEIWAAPAEGVEWRV